MTTAKDIFHKISYLQYPIGIISFYYYYYFLLSMINNEIAWGELNNMLVFLGIALSFATLQDTTTTQNKFSKRVWESPKKGKIMLVLISMLIVGFILVGLIGFLDSSKSIHKEISFGLIVLGISLIGLLKTAGEMFENHRLDKKTRTDIAGPKASD